MRSEETNAERRSREYFLVHPTAWRQSDEEDLTDLLNEHAEEQRRMCGNKVYRLTGDAEARDACHDATGETDGKN